MDDRVNPYAREPAHPIDPAAFGVEVIDTVNCWRLLQRSTFGRFAMEGDDGEPDVLPMNFLVHEGAIYVRSAPGKKLRSIVNHPSVAFEIDGMDVTHYWSVVVRGAADRLSSDEEIDASGVLELRSLSPTPKQNFLRITPRSVTGRRFPRHPRADASADSSRAQTGANPVIDKPVPIPHFPPPRESI